MKEHLMKAAKNFEIKWNQNNKEWKKQPLGATIGNEAFKANVKELVYEWINQPKLFSKIVQ